MTQENMFKLLPREINAIIIDYTQPFLDVDWMKKLRSVCKNWYFIVRALYKENEKKLMETGYSLDYVKYYKSGMTLEDSIKALVPSRPGFMMIGVGIIDHAEPLCDVADAGTMHFNTWGSPSFLGERCPNDQCRKLYEITNQEKSLDPNHMSFEGSVDIMGRTLRRMYSKIHELRICMNFWRKMEQEQHEWKPHDTPGTRLMMNSAKFFECSMKGGKLFFDDPNDFKLHGKVIIPLQCFVQKDFDLQFASVYVDFHNK